MMTCPYTTVNIELLVIMRSKDCPFAVTGKYVMTTKKECCLGNMIILGTCIAKHYILFSIISLVIKTNYCLHCTHAY